MPDPTTGNTHPTRPPATDHADVASLTRRLVAEFLGTGLLVAVVVGSGIAAQKLSPTDTGLQLLQNSLTTVFGLGVLILLFGPVSGAHFNPAVSAVDWAVGRRTHTGLSGRDVLTYTLAQILGGIGGALLANIMFGLAAVQISQHARTAPGLWVGELVATAGLIAVILTLARTGRASLSAASVAAWIGAAYWFTSSTSFANPAVISHHRPHIQRHLRRDRPRLSADVHRLPDPRRRPGHRPGPVPVLGHPRRRRRRRRAPHPAGRLRRRQPQRPSR